MLSLKDLREKIGFTQTEMAQYLGISLGQWAMAETEKRLIPDHAKSKLDFLQNQITIAMAGTMPDEVIQVQKIHTSENNTLLLEHAHVCKTKAKRLKKDLLKLLKKREQCELAARIPVSEKENISEKKTYELIIEVKRRESIETLIDDNRSKEIFLSLQIEMLEEEAIRAIKKSGELNN